MTSTGNMRPGTKGSLNPDCAHSHALLDFAQYMNPQQVRVLKAAGLDIVEGDRSGAWVWDVDGRKFLDCFTSAGSFNIGRRHPRIVAAMHEAVEHLDHGNFLLCSQYKAALAHKLADLAPGGLCCTTFGTGGGEVIDFAIKLARGVTGRSKIISTLNGYHGHTGFALSAAGRDVYKAPFGPLMSEFARVPYGDLDAARAEIDPGTAAVLIEPIQGEGGVVVPPDGYLAGLRQACDESGALLIIDEIQTGFGRTGRWFACEHWGVVPDIMTVAKSLGGSLVAISAAIYTDQLREFLIPNPFIHLSTFGGSDLACAIALETLSVIEDEDLVKRSMHLGERLRGGLEVLADSRPEVFAEVRGLGLMVGIEYRDDSMGPRMSYHLGRHGVLAIYTGNAPSVMRLMPPLVIGEAEIDFLLEALYNAVEDLLNGVGDDEPVRKRPRRRPARQAQIAGGTT
ncbi:MAG: aspartate aminotransferase family protein [Actinobacteria bacterium]|nr:aspartate aminotransferase family protein [Actinomycetota bacterium]